MQSATTTAGTHQGWADDGDDAVVSLELWTPTNDLEVLSYGPFTDRPDRRQLVTQVYDACVISGLWDYAGNGLAGNLGLYGHQATREDLVPTARKVKGWLMHRPMKMRYAEGVIDFNTPKPAVVVMANLLQRTSRSSTVKAMRTLRKEPMLQGYRRYFRILLDVLREEHGNRLHGEDEFIPQHIWRLVRSVVVSTIGPRAMHEAVKPKDVGQRLLWQLCYLVGAKIYTNRP